MPKVSVIIPVYGVEKYIERCARSLFEQTLADIEYIFVDDCTTDRSIEILQNVLLDYPHRNKQTRIVHHEENKGLPIARQTGIKIATGDFIAHCDSDDWVSKDMYQTMYEKAISEASDIIVCDFYKSDGQTDAHLQGMTGDISNILSDILTWKSTAAVWNKLINRDLYTTNPIVYPKMNMGEDFVLIIQLIYYSQGRISYVNEPLYYYFDNSNSITRDPSETSIINKYNQVVVNVRDLEFFLKEKGIIKQYKKEWAYFKHLQRNSIGALIYKPSYRKMWKKTFSEINYMMLCSRYLSTRQRLKLLLTYLGIRVGL